MQQNNYIFESDLTIKCLFSHKKTVNQKYFICIKLRQNSLENTLEIFIYLERALCFSENFKRFKKRPPYIICLIVLAIF